MQTVTDLASLVEPVTVSWDLIDAGEKSIEPLGCEKPRKASSRWVAKNPLGALSDHRLLDV